MQEKVDFRINYVYQALLDFKNINLDNYPLFFSTNEMLLDYKKLYNIIRLLDLTNYNDDIDYQERLLNKLYKVIRGFAVTKYEENKLDFPYVSVASINDALLELFFYRANKNDYYLKELITNFCDFSGSDYNDKKINNYIENICDAYNRTHTLSLEDTSEFANYILNKHRNNYINTIVNEYLLELTNNIKFNTNKSNKDFNDAKICLLRKYLINKDAYYINALKEELNTTKDNILNNKYSKKIKSDSLESVLNKLIDLIIEGNFKQNDLINKGSFEVSKELLFIINLFSKSIYITSTKISNLNVEVKNKETKLHHNKHLVFDYDRYLYNVSQFIVSIDMNQLDKLLSNYKWVNALIDLLPLVDVTQDFSIEKFIQLVINYPINDNTFDIYDNFDYLLKETSNISSINAIKSLALGSDIVFTVGEGNVSKYLDVYKDMLYKNKTSIPPINMDIKNYSFVSGNYDINRLLIGNVPDRNSCIDILNLAGVEAYKELLTSSSGDVILIRNSFNKIVSRIFLIRRGNIVLMVNSFKPFLVDVNAYKLIADEILLKSIEYDDNIEFVFSSNVSSDFLKDYPRYKDSRFVSLFPHADFTIENLLLASKNKDFSMDNLDFELKAHSLYNLVRKDINYDTSLEEVYRLKALYLTFSEDIDFVEKKSIMVKEYSKAISGEDWLLLYNNDEIIEELILPSANAETYLELLTVKGQNKMRIYY